MMHGMNKPIKKLWKKAGGYYDKTNKQYIIDDPGKFADFIAYADNGNDTAGWIDMGVTGASFNQATFGITGPHDGYIFYEAPSVTTGAGNLVIATGANGSDNKIIFAAGGYDSGNEQMSITPDLNVHIEIPTASTSPSTGALTVVGGVGSPLCPG